MASYFRSGSEFAINSATAANQTAPTVASFADGGFVVAWGSLDPAQDGSDSAIKAQLFDAAGNRVGPEFLVNANATGSQFTPSVTTLGDESFVVTWVTNDAAQDGSGNAIKAQLFGRDGVPIGGEFLVNSATASSQSVPVAAKLAGGGFVISWDDWGSFDTKAQIFDAAGAPVGGEFRLNSNTSAAQEYGDIVGLANGGFVATWRTTDTTADRSEQAVKAQLFDAAGSRVGPEFLVNTQAAGSQYSPSITALANGGFVVSWYTTDAAQDGSSGAIKAQLFDASGARVGAEFLVNTQGANLQNDPVVAATADGGFVVAWVTFDTAQDGSGGAVKAQAFDASGAKAGGEMLVNTLTAGTQFLPDIAALPDGRVVVTWVSESGDGSGYAVRGQILQPNHAPVIVSDGGGDAAVVTVAENGTAVTTVVAADSGGAPLRYSIAGADAGLFAIDAATGVLSFLTAPDFEQPSDGDADGIYELVVEASDGELSDRQTLSVEVTNANEGLSIVSGGTVDVLENEAVVATVLARDIDGDPVSYAITGGADAARFTIDALTGVLSFVEPADFEWPADADADNRYDLVVTASDGSFTDEQVISVAVLGVNEGVTIMSGDAADAVALTLAENGTDVTRIDAFDEDGDKIVYAIAGGADAALFAIDAVSGGLTFLAAPDFEQPGDADGDNVYDVSVSASDGLFSDTQSLSVTIANVREGATIYGTSSGNTITTTSSPSGQPRATEYEDMVLGLGGNDTIRTAGGDDIVDGGTGNDQITGGAGADRLTGGSGADRFILTSTSESKVDRFDVITDFSVAQDDRISLSAIDANSNAAYNQRFSFIGANAFTGAAGQLRFEHKDGATWVSGDVNGDAAADFLIKLDGLVNLSASDFVL